MKFTKMHGAGNDFIVINNIEEQIPVEELNALAKKLCHRRFAIGADGFMVVEKPEYGGDYKMRFYNADGTLGEMCGNGARCIARYGYEKGLAGETQRIETTAGMVVGWRETRSRYRIKLNEISRIDMGLELEACGKVWKCAYVELGNPGIPHLVVRVEGLSHDDTGKLEELGKALRYHEALPKGANVNFFDITGEDELVELTYERGVEDFTLACGTGSGSVVSVLTLQNLVSGERVRVAVPGGTLYITVTGEKPEEMEIYLTGPTCISAEGEVGSDEFMEDENE